jgi:hypothetical protein
MVVRMTPIEPRPALKQRQAFLEMRNMWRLRLEIGDPGAVLGNAKPLSHLA